jgi:hypothetical protein
MPGEGRKFFIGRLEDADITHDAYVLVLDLYPEKFEGEEIGGIMMGGLTSDAAYDLLGRDKSVRHDDQSISVLPLPGSYLGVVGP